VTSDGRHEGRMSLAKAISMWEDNIKMPHKGTGNEDSTCSENDKWRALMIMKMTLRDQ
jgi:hypothetical protein